MRTNQVRALVYGAMCLALSFALSYVKLFEMPMGGSITLCSMLPLCVYAILFGPACGFLAAFAYSLLQIIQGAYIVHWFQFLLDYIFAFTCMGVAAFFPRRPALGVGAAGFLRLLCSILSGVIFFSSYAAEAGYTSALWYSIAYNGSSLGVDTLLCIAILLLPPVKKVLNTFRNSAKA